MELFCADWFCTDWFCWTEPLLPDWLLVWFTGTLSGQTKVQVHDGYVPEISHAPAHAACWSVGQYSAQVLEGTAGCSPAHPATARAIPNTNRSKRFMPG
jgi:hypothetical protein